MESIIAVFSFDLMCCSLAIVAEQITKILKGYTLKNRAFKNK